MIAQLAKEMPITGAILRPFFSMLVTVCILLKRVWQLFFIIPFLLCGCASPHRSGTATHELRRYQGRSDGLVSVEQWADTERGGGWFFLTDPQVAVLTAVHTNQTALGGGSSFSGGPMSVNVDPQTGAIISATGTAVGNVVGAAIKTAAKP